MSYEQLINSQFSEYPQSIILPAHALREMHVIQNTGQTDLIDTYARRPDAVFYALKEGSCVGSKGVHCNGIRYGYGGDYCSLINIEASVFNTVMDTIPTQYK